MGTTTSQNNNSDWENTLSDEAGKRRFDSGNDMIGHRARICHPAEPEMVLSKFSYKVSGDYSIRQLQLNTVK